MKWTITNITGKTILMRDGKSVGGVDSIGVGMDLVNDLNRTDSFRERVAKDLFMRQLDGTAPGAAHKGRDDLARIAVEQTDSLIAALAKPAADLGS